MQLNYKYMGQEMSFELQNHLTLGSESHCGILVKGQGIDPRHCRFEIKDTSWIIKDLGSSTGVYLNGSKVMKAVLMEGDEIQLGDLRFYVTSALSEAKAFPLTSKNDGWNRQLEALSTIAKTPYPILLLGPTGSGKDVLARSIHDSSHRGVGPFISVNCSALTESLIESELFGHVKGSFTGAISDRKGAFESARGGTLFLDELGDLPYGMQAKLLRAIENGEVRPVGSDHTIKTNVRIISATHQDLHQKIREGVFREDLLYRLNVVTITSPSLSARMEDFDQLLYSFAKEFRVRFSFAAIQKLKLHDWPGNIRELKNVVMRASALFQGKSVEESDINLLISQRKKEVDEAEIMGLPTERLPLIKELEKQVIVRALLTNFGNQRRAAFELGMPKSTLHDRIKTYNIDLLKIKNSRQA